MTRRCYAPKFVGIVAAITEEFVIGSQGTIPWSYPKDLEKFKLMTTGCAVVMGSKTLESIGRPLPNRFNVVVSRREDLIFRGAMRVPSVEFAIRNLTVPTWIIGGGEIYKQALSNPMSVDVIVLTVVPDIVSKDGAVVFPTEIAGDWRVELDQPHELDTRLREIVLSNYSCGSENLSTCLKFIDHKFSATTITTEDRSSVE